MRPMKPSCAPNRCRPNLRPHEPRPVISKSNWRSGERREISPPHGSDHRSLADVLAGAWTAAEHPLRPARTLPRLRSGIARRLAGGRQRPRPRARHRQGLPRAADRRRDHPYSRPRSRIGHRPQVGETFEIAVPLRASAAVSAHARRARHGLCRGRGHHHRGRAARGFGHWRSAVAGRRVQRTNPFWRQRGHAH